MKPHGGLSGSATVHPATNATLDRLPKSSWSATPLGGSACMDSLETASSPCNACIAPARGSASSSGDGQYRARRSDACCSLGISLRDTDSRRWARRQVLGTAGPVHESRACVGSKPHRRVDQLLCAPRRHVPPTPLSSCRISSRVTWCPCGQNAPDRGGGARLLERQA